MRRLATPLSFEKIGLQLSFIIINVIYHHLHYHHVKAFNMHFAIWSEDKSLSDHLT